jgi:hypothetical protein
VDEALRKEGGRSLVALPDGACAADCSQRGCLMASRSLPAGQDDLPMARQVSSYFHFGTAVHGKE